MANLIGRDALHAEAGGQFLWVEEGKHVVCRFTGIEVPGNGIDMGKDEIHGVLGKVIKRLAFGNDVPEQGVVLFDVWFLG